MITEFRSARDLALADLVDEITRRLQGGEPVDLEALAGEHPELIQQLQELLPTLQLLGQLRRDPCSAAHSNGFSHAGEFPNNPNERADPSSERTLGDFRLLREIGRGGMGVVYEAEQISLGRTVALKVLPFAAMLDTRQLTRFRNEARAAATLHHANIVPVILVGCERSVHFYAMQYIEGESLARIIEQMRRLEGLDGSVQEASDPSLNPERLLELSRSLAPDGFAAGIPVENGSTIIDPTACETHRFVSTARSNPSRAYFHNVAELGIQAAEALDHAHEQGVIHRDIKPANLLVDQAGRLWITDFGLARLESDAGMTMTGDLVGTLRYMSPEQALAKRVVVDHRTDIYSLGVTLYELLALRPAFEGEDRQHLFKQIAFEEPPPLRKLKHEIPVELETIIEKAIRKNPAERYATARDLADDLRSYLADKPIKAKPPSWREKMLKWSRRHPAAVWAAILVLVTTTAISATSALLVASAFRREAASAQQAKTNELQAKTEAARSAQVAAFLQEMLKGVGPSVALGRDTRLLREILNQTATRLDALKDQPAVQAELRNTIGCVYDALGEYALAETMHRDALATRRTLLGTENRRVAESLSNLALARWHEGNLIEGESLNREALAMRQQLLGPEHSEVANSLDNLAVVLQIERKYAEAESIGRAALEMRQKLLGPGHPDIAASLNNLANTLRLEGKLSESEVQHRQALAMRKTLFGDEHPDVVNSLHNLALVLWRQGNLVEAEALYREALATGKKLLDENHTDRWATAYELGGVLFDRGEYAEAEKLLREVVRLRPNIGAAHRQLAIAVLKRAEANGDAPRWDEATGEFAHAIDLTSDGPDWGAPRKAVCLQLAQWDEAFRRVAAIYPKETALWIGRGQFRAYRSQWADAAADYGKVIQERPVGDETAEYAYLLVLLGNSTEYRQFCLDLAARLNVPRNDFEAFTLARACSAGANSGLDARQVLEWGNRGITDSQASWGLNGLGLAQYRAGLFTEAIQTLERPISLNWGRGGREHHTLNWLVMAMAQYRLAHSEKAKECLETARMLIDQERPKMPGEPANVLAPGDWIEANVLLREAESLLGSSATE